MKRTALSALGVWLWANHVSNEEFAAKMAKQLGEQSFSARTVEKWRYGYRTPSRKNIKAIKEITGLTADKIMEGAI